jgi:hypothetical protein
MGGTEVYSRLSWMSFFLVYLSPSMQMLRQYLKVRHDSFFHIRPNPLFTVTFPLDAMQPIKLKKHR